MKYLFLENGLDQLVYQETFSEQHVEIMNIQVFTERRVGKGRRLVTLLLSKIDRNKTKMIFARTRQHNEIARQFYIALGFKELGTLQGFHLDTQESAIVYGLELR